jgi:hypothetical protein
MKAVNIITLIGIVILSVACSPSPAAMTATAYVTQTAEAKTFLKAYATL